MITQISIKWHIEDVLQKAKDMNISLTKQEASDILVKIEHDHDASFGINWTTIEEAINSYKESITVNKPF